MFESPDLWVYWHLPVLAPGTFFGVTPRSGIAEWGEEPPGCWGTTCHSAPAPPGPDAAGLRGVCAWPALLRPRVWSPVSSSPGSFRAGVCGPPRISAQAHCDTLGESLDLSELGCSHLGNGGDSGVGTQSRLALTCPGAAWRGSGVIPRVSLHRVCEVPFRFTVLFNQHLGPLLCADRVVLALEST